MPDPPPEVRPSLRLLLSHPAHFIALGFGSGLAPVAPGTAGSLMALVTFPLLHAALSDLWLGLLLLAVFFVGIWACEQTGRALGVVDHGAIVIDEIVPLWAALWLVPADWRWWLATFVLFRFFDITKPPPARQIDRSMKHGFGVMLDDVVAAFYTVLVLAFAKQVTG